MLVTVVWYHILLELMRFTCPGKSLKEEWIKDASLLYLFPMKTLFLLLLDIHSTHVNNLDFREENIVLPGVFNPSTWNLSNIYRFNTLKLLTTDSKQNERLVGRTCWRSNSESRYRHYSLQYLRKQNCFSEVNILFENWNRITVRPMMKQ